MLSSQEEMEDRRRVLHNDRKVREGGTFHAFAEADAATPRGRFSDVNAAYVVGSKPGIASAYPAASAAHQTELPPEPALGYRINDLEPSADLLSSPAEQPGPTSDDPSPLGRDVGSLSQSGDPAGVHFPSPPGTRVRDAGSPPTFRRRV